MKTTNTRWYTVDQPWGSGDFIRAGEIVRVLAVSVESKLSNPEGNPDCAGEFVCDCVIPTEGDIEREESAKEIAEHIVKSHNWVLDLAMRQVPLDFLIEACERVIRRKALLTVTLGVIGDSGAGVAEQQLKLIQQALELLKQALACEANASN